ncbi:MAG: FHA domain-containing protein [Planctomycetes bacterium]|nr:FHA domain-containing protein [Planctomycetota bacterium]MBI3833514.1 FHA domain-containing protein [Planctomycetota bacterium]
MSETTTPVRELTVELPDTAPQVRITAGYGSAGQKTWNLRRPVTLIGSRRPAHIVLHDKDISAAHCVVVNTGVDVLVKDLHTSSGTYCNDARIDIQLLKDGDRVTIGGTHIQFAIQMPPHSNEDSGCGMKYADPTRFAQPVSLQLVHTDRTWSIEQAACLIGRHDAAQVRLDHTDISARHALLFRFLKGPAIFDLGGRTGIWVNGQRTSLAPLVDGDRVTFGPFGVAVQYGHAADSTASITNSAGKLLSNATVPIAPAPISDLQSKISNLQSQISNSQSQVTNLQSQISDSPSHSSNPKSQISNPVAGATSPDESATQPTFPDVPDALQTQINTTWEGLNRWESRLKADASIIGEQQTSLTRREAEIDARDAALRGKLHDVERFNEQVLARESDSASNAAKIQASLDDLIARQKAADERDRELVRRQEELQRRENALTQRWTRLQSTTCAKCGARLNLNAGQVANVT